MRRKIVITGLVLLTILITYEISTFVIWRPVSFQFVKSTDYNEDAAREIWWQDRRVNEPFTWLEVTMNQQQFAELDKWSEFANTVSFDFENYCVLVSYGRELVELKRIRKVNSYLRATFSEYAGAKVFFYQLERHSYMPTGFYTEHYIMEDGERTPIRL